MDKDSRTIVVTGCSYGLGEALVVDFIARGHTVHGCGRSADKMTALTKRFGAPHSFTAVDVGDDASVASWAKKVLGAGPVDLLINNAAIMNRQAPLWEQTAEEFDAMLRINVSGVVNCIRHFTPAMIERKSGVIVNLSSGWGRSVSEDVAPYCATKFAVEALSRAMAEELPKGMASIPMSPGVINTHMLKIAWGDSADAHPEPEEWVKRAAPFILQLSAKDNGQSVTVPKS